jgi:hypothetical protein
MSNKIMLAGLSLGLGMLSGVTLAGDEGDDWNQNGRTNMADYFSATRGSSTTSSSGVESIAVPKRLH